MKSKRIYLSQPQMSGEEVKYVSEALLSGSLFPFGENIELLSNGLKSIFKSQVLLTSSGTSALHLILSAMGIERGDIVLVQSLTFCATANPAIYCGADPVFIDSEKDSWNMCPNMLRHAISDLQAKNKSHRIKAVIPVHLYGMPANVKEINDIVKPLGIPVIHDAAEALGSLVDKTQVGSDGFASIISFNSNKIITGSGGGALVTKNEKLISVAGYFANQAKTPALHYQHQHVGFNYRYSNVNAGIAYAQFRELNWRVEKKREIFKSYKDLISAELAGLGSFSFQKESKLDYSNRWLTCVLLDEEIIYKRSLEEIILYLDKQGIECRPIWKPMHMQPVFSSCEAYVNGISEDLFYRGICLPSSLNLEKSDINYVVTKLKEAILHHG